MPINGFHFSGRNSFHKISRQKIFGRFQNLNVVNFFSKLIFVFIFCRRLNLFFLLLRLYFYEFRCLVAYEVVYEDVSLFRLVSSLQPGQSKTPTKPGSELHCLTYNVLRASTQIFIIQNLPSLLGDILYI